MLVRRFIDINRNLSSKLSRLLTQSSLNMFDRYDELVHHFMCQPNQLIVDVGGGKRCPFAKYRQPGTRIVAVDISNDELNSNCDVDERKVADITRELPFASGEVDLITSRHVLEHLDDLQSFFAESLRVLRPGGVFIHLFPSKFAPFAMLNQLIPRKIATKALFFFRPDTVGICGFRAHYDHCYYSAVMRILRRQGFDVTHVELGYSQSEYFDFFVPLYLLSAGYERLVQAVGLRNLCATILIVGRKPDLDTGRKE